MKVNLGAVTRYCTAGDNFPMPGSDTKNLTEMEKWKINAHPAETLDGIWGCLYNNYRSVLESDGGNQYKIAHNNGRKRARETGSSVDLELSRDLYNKVRRTLRL